MDRAITTSRPRGVCYTAARLAATFVIASTGLTWEMYVSIRRESEIAWVAGYSPSDEPGTDCVRRGSQAS